MLLSKLQWETRIKHPALTIFRFKPLATDKNLLHKRETLIYPLDLIFFTVSSGQKLSQISLRSCPWTGS